MIHATRDLTKLEHMAARRTLRLRALVDGYNPPVSPEHDRLISYVTIETVNLWAGFSRAYYLSCVLGARTTAGARITFSRAGVSTPHDALRLAVATFNPRFRGAPTTWRRRDEPAWHDIAVLLRLVTELACSSLPDVRVALGYTTTVFQHLPVFRNFFAHRNEDTARKTSNIARGYALSPRLRPAELLVSRRPGRPQSVICDWLDDMYNVITLVCR